MATTTDPARVPVAVAMIVATLWGTAPLVALLCTRHHRDADQSATSTTELDGGPVTTVVRIGDEPDGLVAGTVALARLLGPVAVVGRRPTARFDEAVRDHCGDPVGDALRSIAEESDTPAMLLVSGRIATRPDAARRAAARIAGGAGWVSGSTRSFNDDRFAPERRDRVGALLRRRAQTAGLTLWEPDATLVATSLLRRSAPERGRPYGHWLREQAASGTTGVVTDEEPAVRAAPVSSRDFWPDAVARQRAAAADLADALVGRGTGSGGVRGRCTAAALLLRELYAWPLLVWLAAPVLLAAGMPFRVDPALGAAVLVGLAVARWAALRHALGLGFTPRADVLAAVHGVPGSLWAAASAVTRRVRRPRWALPSRPLVWAAMLATVVAGVGLVRIEPGTPGSRTVALLCIALLVGLWVLTVRALVERTWERTSFRLPVALAATVDGDDVRVVDAGPAGVAVEVPDALEATVGDEVVVELLDDGPGDPLRLGGVVASRRPRSGSTILGVELHIEGLAQERWIQRLAAAAAHRPTAAGTGTTARTSGPTSVGSDRLRGSAPPPRHPVAALIDRATVAVVIGVSLVVVAALLLVLLGFRPLVIRSGSMAPTHRAGDIVITDRIRAADMEVGDVVSLDHYPPIGEGMTHRVESIRSDGDTVDVTTRGDANDSGETWAVATDQQVGRVVAAVPGVGRAAISVRTSWTVALVVSLLVAAVVGLLLVGRRGGRWRAPHRRRQPVEG